MSDQTEDLGTLQRVGNRLQGRMERLLEQDPQAVWAMLTEPQKLAELEAEFKTEAAGIERSFDPQTEELGKVSLKPKKVNIDVQLVALAWAPYWHDTQGGGAGALKPAWT